jgi:predicted PurR-regulated permease PerM
VQALRELFAPVNLRRAVLLAIFAGLVVAFRHLLVVLIFFVAFERPLEAASDWLASRLRVRRSVALVGVLALGSLALGGALWFGLDRALDALQAARQSLPERIAAFRDTPFFRLLQEHVNAETLVEAAKHNTERALGYLSAFGHLLVHALVGFVLAIVFIIDEDELRAFERTLAPESLGGTLLRWLGYAADAISVTLQFQLVVAFANALLTWPVLMAVGLAHSGALVFMIFVSGIVPVVGNFISGAVLTALAYQAQGLSGVVLFTVLTFVLHKLESYFLNPRLAARHVRLPGFVLIVSLLLWEQLLGFVGLFVSFPFLYLVQRIWSEFAEQDAAAAPALSGA